MKFVGMLLIILLVTSAVAVTSIYVMYYSQGSSNNQDFYFGTSFGGNTTAEAKLLIDKVKNYTNYFLINSYDVSNNETVLNEICNYAAESDLYFTVYFFTLIDSTWKQEWVEAASQRWGEKFLGIYLRDEPGGRQIDLSETVPNAVDYSDAANRYINYIASNFSMQTLNTKGVPVFTSDYALYYYDYLAGHDIVFVELGWNSSRSQQISLCRGAANVLDKEWGAIITWTYLVPPYIESGPEILEDMYTAYNAGAKYLVVFNWPVYPEGNPYGILTEEHFEAMQQFWQYAQTNHVVDKISPQAAFVLPKDYGAGLRHPDDKIWGIWEPDNQAQLIWTNMNKLSDHYGLKLDIIYDDGKIDPAREYEYVYLWNQTVT